MSSISVVIPTYNRADMIGETLTALRRQTLPPDEIIVVDDGSTDGTAEIIRSLDSEIIVIRQDNAGPAVARNRGLQKAKGELIQFFDSDDLPALNKLEVQNRALEASGGDIAYCPWVKARLGGGVAKCEPCVLQQRPLPAGLPPLRIFVRGWVTVLQTCLVRRSLLERAGCYYDTRLMPTEDSEFLFRMLMAGAKLVHTPDTLVVYRLHESNQISGSALDNTRLARDWALYKQIVNERLQTETSRISAFDRAIWAAETAESATEAEVRLRPAERVALFIHRIQRSLWRRMLRPRLPAAYGEGSMSDSQHAMLQALGYDACLM